MGGKKGPEKNRKYERDRRNRFNDQFNELNKLLPDFNSATMKVTKTEIISRVIQYLRETQSKKRRSPENKMGNEESKVNELQKKVAGLLQIIKDLIKLLHESNINFPASLPVDDLKAFKEAYIKCKRKLQESSENENKMKKNYSENLSGNSSLISGTELIETADGEKVELPVVTTSSTVSAMTVSCTSSCTSEPQSVGSAQIMNVNSSSILRVNTNPVIVPQGNLLTVNGLTNTMLNSVNSSPTILLNKQVTVPTLIFMQNSIVPVSTVQQIRAAEEKLIVPKVVVSSTSTTFINKKPIPAVRPYKSIVPSNKTSCTTALLKCKRSRRSKGILVNYPKRKPSSKHKKRDVETKKVVEISVPINETADKPVENNVLESCNSALNSFSSSSEEVRKNYTDNLFDTQDIQNTSQFIDFFENPTENVNSNDDNNNNHNNNDDDANNNTDSKKNDNDTNNVNSTCLESGINSKSNVDCNLVDSKTSTEPVKEPESSKSTQYLPVASFSNAESLVRDENPILEKRKYAEKEITPLTIQCNCEENKSVAKDLNLSFDDKGKHYESSFDEFSSDLFLHVPSSGQHADSISPTAAFLSNFPLVSSLKNTDLLHEHEEDSGAAATNSTTILQIGNLDSPSTLIFTHKNTSNRDIVKNVDKEDNYAFCAVTSDLEIRSDKKKECKETTPRDVFNLDTFINHSAKNISNSKDAVTQNIHLYPTSTSSTFSNYSRLTKYNDIHGVTPSFYNFNSPPTFPVSKAPSDLGTEYNSWMPTYNQEDTNKERKRDKSMPFRNTFGLPATEASVASEKLKTKKPKQNVSRALVNWMTSPDSRNASETLQPFSDVFSATKDDTTISSAFLNSPSVQNNTNFTSYSSTDYLLDSQSYGDAQLSNKIPYSAANPTSYSSTNPTSYSWSPSKTTLPTLSLDAPNIMIPSTLPTLVGDLALGNTNTLNGYDAVSKKVESDKRKNYQRTPPQNSSSFLSVTRLVDGKSMPKKSNDACNYADENRDKCYKENYHANKSIETGAELKKSYSSSVCKESSKSQFKCRKETVKCSSSNGPTNRCSSKENKKDNRLPQKLCEYSSQSFQMTINKDVNPLSNKNSNYSAEALIGSNNHSNSYSTQNYFSYDNSNSYNNCPSNKKLDESDSLTNVGYYSNTNYMYANNFQSFNNYGFSNQYCNNYSSQMQQNSSHKKRDDGQQSKQDSAWYKDGLSSYGTIVSSEFSSQHKEKYKQTFTNKYNCGQKSSTVYNSYYQYDSSTPLNHSKNSCNFNAATYSFSQAGQQCPASNCQATGYDMKLNRATSSNTNNVVPPTTLTNFNLSTIIPEINDKHCMQPRVNVGNEKNNFKYGTSNEMNYNYLIQPASEANTESTSSLYSSSGLPISHYSDFVSRKHQK